MLVFWVYPFAFLSLPAIFPFPSAMKIRSIWYCDHIPDEDLMVHECSDRIWVPRRMFERWLGEEDAGTVVTIQLDEVYGCMYAPHGGPNDTLYVPSWMCRALKTQEVAECKEEDMDDYIVPIRCRPEMCMFIRVQPHTSEHLRIGADSNGDEVMPEDALARGFDSYTCINEGQTLTLRLENGETMDVSILEAHPSDKRPLCIRAGEIALELLPPLDLPIPEPFVPVMEPVAEEPVVPAVEPVVPPKPLTQEERATRRELMAKAALARFQAPAPGDS